jgi:hypothetical protein
MHPEGLPNPGRSPDSLPERLRALPAPPVPDGLEARLLAAIPAPRPTLRRRWAAWVVAAGALAAACLLAALAWQGRDGERAVRLVPTSKSVDPSRNATLVSPPAPRPADDSAAAWRQTRRLLDGADVPAFTWPLPEAPPRTVSASPPADLLN